MSLQKRVGNCTVSSILDFVTLPNYQKLTASKLQRASLSIHREILQIHRASGFNCQSVNTQRINYSRVPKKMQEVEINRKASAAILQACNIASTPN